MSTTTMQINYNKAVFANNGEWTYESVGLLKEHVKGMSIKFTKNNLAGSKRVTIIATPKKGDPITFSCTKPLSEIVRKALETKDQLTVLGTLLNCDVKVDSEDSNKYFIFQPEGTLLEGLQVTDSVIENFEDVAF